MLRFVFVTTFYPPHHFGGDALLVRHMAHALARAGHTVDVVYDADAYRAMNGRAVTAPSPESADDEQRGVRVHSLRSRLGLLSPILTHQLGRPVVHRRALRRLLEEGVDVVHFHNVSLVGGPEVLTYGDALKLYTAHEHWLVCPTHVLWRHDREPCAGRECLRCIVRYRRPPQLWRWSGLLERSVRHVDAFCSPSRFSIDKHREFGFTPPMRLLAPFLPDPPPQALQAPAAQTPGDGPTATPGPGDAPVFLFVGRLERIKGLADVIPVFRDGVAGKAELWIAGAGTQEAELRRLAGDGRQVRFLGRVDPDTVRRLLRRCRALVVPSAGFEVFPLVTLEAFRDGTPVIARRLGPLPEVLEAAAGGILFSTREELTAAIERLAREPDEARRLGQNARAAFESRWSEAAFLRTYHELIAGLARDRGRTDILRRCENEHTHDREEVRP